MGKMIPPHVFDWRVLVHNLVVLDVELTWACQGSTGVITCFPDIVIVHDLRTCLTSCRVAPAMKPVHTQCLMAHQSKIYDLEVIHWLWSTEISLSVCSLCANNLFSLILGVLHVCWTCKYVLPVRLALLGVSCRWQHDSPRPFHSNVLAWGQHCVVSLFLSSNDLCTAKWSIDLQALPMAHTRQVVLLHIQPHFCECLLYTWRCWLSVCGLAVHFNCVPAVGLSFSHFRCLFT